MPSTTTDPADFVEIELPDGEHVRIRVRVSPRCRRLQLRALPGGLELVYPLFMPRDRGIEFIYEHREWVNRVFRKIRKRLSRPEAKFPPDQIELAFSGLTLPVILRKMDVCWTGARINQQNQVELAGNIDDKKECAKALRAWLIREAEKRMFPFADEIAEALQVNVTRYRCGLQRRTWGTCTSKGVVTLNAALLMFRPQLARYVIFHEFAHCYEMNHSPRFWAIVEKWCPGAKAFRAELNQRAAALPAWIWEDPAENSQEQESGK